MGRFIIPLLIILCGPAASESISLKIPRAAEGGHDYFPELLLKSFEAAGHQLTLISLDTASPQNALRLLEEGELDLAWFLSSPAREKGTVPLEFNLTKGLGGHRILFLPKNAGLQDSLNQVSTLQEFRNLKLAAGIVIGSRDAEIWKANGLEFFQWHGSVRDLSLGLSEEDSPYRYIPRSILEAPREILAYPRLSVEKTLLFIYPEDYHFSLSPKAGHWAPLILDSLEKADRKGVIARLISQKFRSQYENYGFLTRKKLFLRLPSDP